MRGRVCEGVWHGYMSVVMIRTVWNIKVAGHEGLGMLRYEEEKTKPCGTVCQLSCWCHVLCCAMCHVSCTLCFLPHILCPVLSVLCPLPCALCPVPCGMSRVACDLCTGTVYDCGVI